MLVIILLLTSYYPEPEPPYDTSLPAPEPSYNTSSSAPDPSYNTSFAPPYVFETSVSNMFFNFSYTVVIDPIKCKTPYDVGIDSNHTLYFACRDSQCVYTSFEDTSVCLQDRAFYHYNAHMSGIYIKNDMLVTCQNSYNDYGGTKSPNMFMGLTLYDLRYDWIRTDGSKFEDALHQIPYISHVDMLHEAPNCTAVTSANTNDDLTNQTNKYLHFDGFNKQLVYTDFESPHGLGSMDHSTATVKRLYGLPLENVSSIAIDVNRKLSYVSDYNQNKIFKIEYESGIITRSAKHDYPIYSSNSNKFKYWIVENSHWELLANIQLPIGLDIFNRHLYVLSEIGMMYIFDVTNDTNINTFSTIKNAISMRIFDSTMFVISSQRLHIFVLQTIKSRNDTILDPLADEEMYCIQDSDCKTMSCNYTTCMQRKVNYSPYNELSSYVSSEIYNRSFVNQNILSSEHTSSYANYLNMYPIMESDFCSTIGNASGVLDCELIDFDSLLLGNCWGHPCLPNHLHCLNGGILNKNDYRGYVCICDDIHYGDICQLVKHPQNVVYTKQHIQDRYQRANCCFNESCIVSL